MLLKISFYYSFQLCKKNTINIEQFLHSCENYLFISQHQMHELIICDSLPSVCPQSTHCLKASRTFQLLVCKKKKKALYWFVLVVHKISLKHRTWMERWHWTANKMWFVDMISSWSTNAMSLVWGKLCFMSREQGSCYRNFGLDRSLLFGGGGVVLCARLFSTSGLHPLGPWASLTQVDNQMSPVIAKCPLEGGHKTTPLLRTTGLEGENHKDQPGC